MLISYANRNTQVPKLGVSVWSFIREGHRQQVKVSLQVCKAGRPASNGTPLGTQCFLYLPCQEISDSCVGTLGHKNSTQPSAAKFASGSTYFLLVSLRQPKGLHS